MNTEQDYLPSKEFENTHADIIHYIDWHICEHYTDIRIYILILNYH